MLLLVAYEMLSTSYAYYYFINENTTRQAGRVPHTPGGVWGF